MLITIHQRGSSYLSEKNHSPPPDFKHIEVMPENLKDMISVAERLSVGLSF